MDQDPLSRSAGAGTAVGLLIIGAGTAGLACAITAAQRGVAVAVVDADAQVGGTLAVGGSSLSAAGARRQRAKGIEDSPERHFEDVMRMTEGRARSRSSWRLAVEEAAATVDWLEDLGYPFHADAPAHIPGQVPYSVPRTYWSTRGPGAVLETLRAPWEHALASGNVTLALEHRLERLGLLAPGGVEALVRGPDGEPRMVRAAALVLACGGYGSNPELVDELAARVPPLPSLTHARARGDGLLAARELGAVVRNEELYVPIPGTVAGPDPRRALPGRLALAAQRRPLEIYVNARGERFIDETQGSERALTLALGEQPGAQMWVVFDERALRRRLAPAVAAGARRSCANVRSAASRCGARLTSPPWLCARASIATDLCGRSRPARLHCYAIRSVGGLLMTPGGLRVDGELRVLDAAGAPIPGLYAAGEILGAGATMGAARAQRHDGDPGAPASGGCSGARFDA